MLDASDHLGIWLTRDAVESGWVEAEWESVFNDELKSRTTKVFPLLAEDCKLPRFLSGKLFADFRHDYRQGLLDLLKAVGQQSCENELGMKFTLILPGTFLMGTQMGQVSDLCDKAPSHDLVGSVCE